MNEKTLAARLAKGDEKALAQIIRQYSGYVCTVAFNFSRGTLRQEDIDDVAAEVFGKLWERRENINADIGLRAYLSASVRNNIKNRMKQNPPLCEDISELEIPSDLLVEETAELHDMMRCLYEGMERLSEDEQELFFRFYFYGETASRIAAEKGSTKGAVDIKLHRIRQKLKDYLNERGYYNV